MLGGSAGVHEERGMCGEKCQELGRPWWFLDSVSEWGIYARETDGEPQKGKPGN